MAYTIDIDGYIGVWQNSKTYVKSIMAKHEKKPVSVRMSSMGGKVADAIDIAAQFEAHGDVTVDMIGLNASACTVATLGAKTVRAHINSGYLIHKAMSPIDIYAYMNEDHIDELIKKLEKEKKENEKVTLILARMYVNRSKKSLSEILNLMKEETWLNAEEAKEWGFVNEIYGKSSEKINYTNELKELVNAAGLPLPSRFAETKNNSDEDKSIIKVIKEEWEELKNSFSDIFNSVSVKKEQTDNNPQTPIINMKKEWTHVNTILSVDGVEESEGKVNLSVADLEKLNAGIEKANQAKLDAEGVVTEKTNRIVELETELKNLKDSDGDTTGQVAKINDGGKTYSAGTAYENLAAAIELEKLLPKD
ncbi:ATP-dependent Clp protease proteolytic subunit [Dysgonomonas sp. HGC4]|uniref:ATP-dependent Clp protease proteolytic subunit n=1 Tax=Dysgonomonas sp. HGC4 TaxID=1658009 RepID=UPI000681A338|nr:ATP-dependent Clp protease proteolytic subunit [Dysgonomonas sp. HGC4]MBD8349362.1 ATP-dependent Clp protease proteolytic subunit [Dysgonomonas sp. HGC4]